MSRSTYKKTVPATVDGDPIVFDPEGDVLTTDHLNAYLHKGRPMLNNYVRDVKVGGGQHGTVYLCQRINTRVPPTHPEHRLEVAMKSVKRVNPREEKMKKMMQHHRQLPTSPHGVSVADKVYSTEAKIKKEIAIMKKLRHPNVVRLYEVIDDRMKEKIYMVMEYLGGGEVKWRDNDSNPVLTVGQTRRIVRDALLGLEYLHYQGIIHRDIKPANLLWTEDRAHVKIGDFGVSHFSYAQRLAAAGADGSTNTPNDPLDPLLLDDSSLTRRAGTPSFLAPEVIWEFRGTKGKSLFGNNSSETQSAPAAAPSLYPASSGSRSPPASTSHAPSSGGHSQQSLHSPLVDATTRPAPLSHSSSVTSSPSERPPITKAIDVWALGVTLYCLLFGRTPFAADKIVPNATEWMLYECIANDEWDVPNTMGWDRVATGGRFPLVGVKVANAKRKEKVNGNGKTKEKSRSDDEADEEEGEGPGIVRLLDRFLQKEPSNRITLDEVKLFPLYTDSSAPPSVSLFMPAPISKSKSKSKSVTSSAAFLTSSKSSPSLSSLSTLRLTSPSNLRLSKPRSNSTPAFKASSFILMDLKDPDDWIRRTSPFPTPRITASSNEASEAMSAVKFRADWGTRLVRHFSHWLKRTRPPGAGPSGGTVPTAASGSIGMNGAGTTNGKVPILPSEVNSRAPINGNLAKKKSKEKPHSAVPQQPQEQKLYRPLSKGSKKALKQPNHQQNGNGGSSQASSPVEPRSDGGWWRRNVAGILSWSPDKFDGKPKRQRRKDEKKKKKSKTRNPSASVGTVGIGGSGFEYGDDLEDGEVYDPIESSRTFDEAHEYSYRPAQHDAPNQNHDYNIKDQLNPLSPPTQRHSEEALRMYRPSPSSSDSISRPGGVGVGNIVGMGGVLTAARRASSWGQGDESGFEIESVKSMDVGPVEMSERVMLVGAGGVQQGGVVLPMPVVSRAQSNTILDEDGVPGQMMSGSTSDYILYQRPGSGAGTTSIPGLDAISGPSLTQATHSSGNPQSQDSAQANVQRLTPILASDATSTSNGRNHERRTDAPLFDIPDSSTISSSRTYDDEDGEESSEWHRGSELSSMHSHAQNALRPGEHDDSEDVDDLSSQDHHFDDDDDDDDASSDHAVTFSPRRRPVLQSDGDVDDARL